MSTVKPIPDHYPTATPYLTVKDAVKAIEFYKQAFGATESMRLVTPSGTIGHAEIIIGTSPIMLSDEFPEMGMHSPQALGSSPVSIHLYVEDADATFNQAIAAGAKEMMAIENQFYGDRMGTIIDPFGHTWMIATHQEDVLPEELQQRFIALYGDGGSITSSQ
ncbi:MAG: VOC family protein [Timaviella obliquedivisa GSE-PSE-MK23-08B]|jgi:PhnB protein|nr:VOC family protein [Timaviella obliquedivisa GSE-PSE-MK23-08B]